MPLRGALQRGGEDGCLTEGPETCDQTEPSACVAGDCLWMEATLLEMLEI